MSITFTQIPADLLVPGQYQEIDNSLAGSVSDVKKALIIATMSPAGSATPGKPVNVLSAAKAKTLCGAGSPATVMAAAFLDKNTTEELWLLPAAEPAAGTKWSKLFKAAVNSGSGAGSVTANVNGTPVSAAVAAGAADTAVAAAIAAAVNGLENSPVEIEVGAAGAFTVSSIIKGAAGNFNTVSFSSDATGVSITAGAETNGTGVPDISALLSGLGSVRYHYWATEFADAESLKAIAAELKDRYSATRQIGGRCFVPLAGKVGDKSTEGSMLYQAKSVNSPHIVLVPRGESLQLPCVWAAVWCAVLCRILADDPAANTYDTELGDLTADGYSFTEREKLLEAGIATYRVDSTGTVLAERIVTTYNENSDGARDTSYLDIQVTETVDAIRTYINDTARKRFKTWKLASTEENFGAGAKVMTPGVWRSFLAELYESVFIREKQWCQDFDSYKKSITVAVKTDSKTRLEYIHQPVLIGQFLVGAGLNQFK